MKAHSQVTLWAEIKNLTMSLNRSKWPIYHNRCKMKLTKWKLPVIKASCLSESRRSLSYRLWIRHSSHSISSNGSISHSAVVWSTTQIISNLRVSDRRALRSCSLNLWKTGLCMSSFPGILSTPKSWPVTSPQSTTRRTWPPPTSTPRTRTPLN